MLALRKNYQKDTVDENRLLENIYTCMDEHGYTYLVQSQKFRVKYGDVTLSGDISDLDALINTMTDYGDISGLPVLNTEIIDDFNTVDKMHKFLQLQRTGHVYILKSRAGAITGYAQDWISLKKLLTQMQKAQRIETYKH